MSASLLGRGKEAEISSLSSYGQFSPLDFESVSDGVGKM
ncbi:hypothetical protein QE432_005018 [Agrobacterium sp. SORGH_AS 745]|nr:hypothetical protein [Agrobacterium sp. SORGH_AS_0745]